MLQNWHNSPGRPAGQREHAAPPEAQTAIAFARVLRAGAFDLGAKTSLACLCQALCHFESLHELLKIVRMTLAAGFVECPKSSTKTG